MITIFDLLVVEFQQAKSEPRAQQRRTSCHHGTAIPSDLQRRRDAARRRASDGCSVLSSRAPRPIHPSLICSPSLSAVASDQETCDDGRREWTCRSACGGNGLVWFPLSKLSCNKRPVADRRFEALFPFRAHVGPVVMQCSSVVGGLQMEWVGFARCRHRAAALPRLHRARFCACARLKTVVRRDPGARRSSCHVMSSEGRAERRVTIGSRASVRQHYHCWAAIRPRRGLVLASSLQQWDRSVLAVMHEAGFGEMKAGRNAFCYHYPSIFHVDDDERAAPSKLA